MCDFQWCHVKFVCDGVVSDVPTSFFKVVVEALKSPKDLCVGEHYQVFWSPNQEDTPQKLIQAGNKILDMDNTNVRLPKKAGPLKGYFEAVLLDLKESEDSFDDFHKVTTMAKGWVRIPSNKLIESSSYKRGKSSKTPNANIPKTSTPKQIQKQAAQQASKANIMTLLEKCQVPSTSKSDGSAKRKVTLSSSEDEEDGSSCTSHPDNDSEDTEGTDYWKKKYMELQAAQSKKKSKERKKSKSKNSLKKHTPQDSLKPQHSKGSPKNLNKGLKFDQASIDSDEPFYHKNC